MTPTVFTFETAMLPPPDNALHRSLYKRVIASKPYRLWLDAHATLVMLALRAQGFRAPDATRWWDVAIAITLTPKHRSDATNYTKATLDLLGGAQIVGGRVAHMGGLYANDRRVRRCAVEWTGVARVAHLAVVATACAPPGGWVAPRRLRRGASTEGAD